MDELFRKFLRIGSTVTMGSMFLIPAYSLGHRLFALTLISLGAAITLAIRVHVRRHRMR